MLIKAVLKVGAGSRSSVSEDSVFGWSEVLLRDSKNMKGVELKKIKAEWPLLNIGNALIFLRF